jgi:hypothetical protein
MVDSRNLGFDQDSYTPTGLFVPGFPVLTKAVTIPTGITIAKNTVLGKITKGAATKAAKTGGNTGDGTLVLDETTPILAKAKPGVYTVRILRAAIASVGTTPAVPAQKALAILKDPDGVVLAVVDVPTSTGVTISNHVKFVLTEGNTAFVLGDGFDITIAIPSTVQHDTYDADNLNGTEEADCILSEDVTGGDAAIVATAYRAGHFNEAAVIGIDAAAKVTLEKKSIFFSTIQ